MNSKQDKECERGDDIILLSEIIINSRYWQDSCNKRQPYIAIIKLKEVKID